MAIQSKRVQTSEAIDELLYMGIDPERILRYALLDYLSSDEGLDIINEFKSNELDMSLYDESEMDLESDEDEY